jgi:hypothetical protein
MSTQHKDPARYDDLLPLFGIDTTDKRPRLILDALHNHVEGKIKSTGIYTG